MATDREGFDLWCDIKRKDWKQIFSHRRWRYSWKLTILDTFITRYHKFMGCRMFGHNYKYMADYDDNYFCYNCYKWETKENYLSSKRERTINKLL